MTGAIDERSHENLSRGQRWTLGVAALLLLAAGAALPFIGFSAETVERDAEDRVVSTTVSRVDHDQLALAALAAGLLLGLVAVNGRKLGKLSVGPLGAEVTAAVAAKTFSKSNKEPQDVEVESALPTEAQQPPVEPPKTQVTIAGDKADVYGLADVPIRVMKDLLEQWPESIPRPADYSEFEFAARRPGKGNNSWVIKFKDAPAFAVSYGGQGKKQATVAKPAASKPVAATATPKK